MYYEDYGLLVELDGRLGHTGTGRFRDMRRDNSATTDGLATLRYGHSDVFGSPCEVAQEVGVNLARLGWQGIPDSATAAAGWRERLRYRIGSDNKPRSGTQNRIGPVCTR